MSNLNITVDNLSKAYRLGLKEDLPDTFVGAVSGWLKKPIRNWRKLRELDTSREAAGQKNEQRGNTASILWALNDISFRVYEGEVVGVIGRNGSGKSTLLKILSRITEPTSGRAVIRGRVSSLLEVGTGFHPELSGRENVYMNGTILGMRKKEIDHKFDEIVEFSGVDRFLDTPMKRYSSGMQVRLAFAVAAHLEPEILIIDEVLAVGDSEFQKKCLGKMEDIAKGGRTVLFVSHNMAAVQNLCHRGIVIANGQCVFDGGAKQAVAEYLDASTASHAGHCSLLRHPSRKAECETILQSVQFRNVDGVVSETFETGKPMVIEFTIQPTIPLRSPHIGVGFDSPVSGRVFSVATYLSDSRVPQITELCKVKCTIPSLPLVPGRYYLSLSAGTLSDKLLDQIEQAVHIDVMSGDFYGNGAAPTSGLGPVAVHSTWKKTEINQ